MSPDCACGAPSCILAFDLRPLLLRLRCDLLVCKVFRRRKERGRRLRGAMRGDAGAIGGAQVEQEGA